MQTAEDLALSLREQEWIDDPFLGPVSAADFEAGSPVWPGNPRWRSIRIIAVTGQAPRTVTELHFVPADPGSPFCRSESSGTRRRGRAGPASTTTRPSSAAM